MPDRLPILVIQNTWYHFETTIAIYQLLEDAGYKPYVYRCAPGEDVFNQAIFLKEKNIAVANNDVIKKAAAGIVISAYPNPHVDKKEAIPNAAHLCLPPELRNKLLFISHRFRRLDDYVNNLFGITAKTTFCLSPNSARIGIDYLFLVASPVTPETVPYTRPLKLAVQGHLELENRRIAWLSEALKKRTCAEFALQIIGTHAGTIAGPHFESCDDVTFVHEPSEQEFYSRLSRDTHFLLPLIDGEMKRKTYVIERYSSNFMMAWALEKPVFCHEVFKDIYNTPGIYYNYANVTEKFDELLATSEAAYGLLLKRMREQKKIHQQTNMTKMRAKLTQIISD